MGRLGVGNKKMHEINPRLVYASGTGYGLSGPDRDNLAMDLTIQAVSGLISVTGEPDRPPIFFVQAEDGIRDGRVTGVQTCAPDLHQRARSRCRNRGGRRACDTGTERVD